MHAPQAPKPDDAGLHTKPALAPLFGTACIVAGGAMALFGARSYAPLAGLILRAPRPSPPRSEGSPQPWSSAPRRWRRSITGAGCTRPGSRRTSWPTGRFGYGLALVLSFHLFMVARDGGGDAHLRALLFDAGTQLISVAALAVVAGVAYAGWLHPLCGDADDGLVPYQAIVEAQKASYDFALGVEYPDDWKSARTGRRRWLTLPEHSLWTNLFIFGGIDSGKTSSLAYPLVLQALAKFKEDAELRPSIVLLDLKGDNALRLYDFCKKLGREDELFIISPGNQILERGAGARPQQGRRADDPEGALPHLEPDRRKRAPRISAPPSCSTGSPRPTTDRSSAGAWSTSRTSRPSSCRRPCRSSTSSVATGRLTLLDVYHFAYDPNERNGYIDDARVDGTTAQLYFKNRFQQMKPEDQGHLISGLTAKLSKITSPSLASTFCAKATSTRGPRAFPGFIDLVVNRPGIIVFSVPEAIYSRQLCRVLGIMFLRAFHTEVLRRSTSQFAESGGNTKRLVMNVVDECWAFMNKGVASLHGREPAGARVQRVPHAVARSNPRAVPRHRRGQFPHEGAPLRQRQRHPQALRGPPRHAQGDPREHVDKRFSAGRAPRRVHAGRAREGPGPLAQHLVQRAAPPAVLAARDPTPPARPRRRPPLHEGRAARGVRHGGDAVVPAALPPAPPALS